MEIKTTSQITQEHKRFLSSVDEMPMNIYLNKANKKWVSVDSLKQVINEYQQINDLNVGLDEMLIERLENALISNSVKAKTNKD